MATYSRFLAILVLSAIPVSAQDTPAADQREQQIEFFEKKVRPLLAANCYGCHSADTNSKGGLRVDDRNGLLTGGGRGAALVPGDVSKSLMIKAVRQTDEKLKMPPGKQLTEEEIGILTKWVEDGAAWPDVRIPLSIKFPPAKYESLRKEHWAWQPLKAASIPAVKDSNWPRNDIDRFVLAGLEAVNLSPVGDADKVTLIRRVTFDITGLPPTPREIDDFLSDSSAESFARVVDRLLASPAYAEQWGRHWLDLARYGESTGSARNLPLPHAWRYRDYVIQAFHQDKSYREFLQEQIAGDLLPAANPAERDEHLVATGFLALGVKDVNQRFKVRYIMDNVDEQIDTVTRSILALTASCARCHDHKFDPIPTADYYGLAGIFRSSEICDGLRNKMGGGGLDYYDTKALIALSAAPADPNADPAKIEELKKAVEEARKEFVALRDSKEGDEKAPNGRPKRQVARQKMNRLQQELSLLSDPAARGGVTYGVRDAKLVADTEIRIRGEAEKLGPVVPRSLLSVMQIPGQPAINPQQSGRLELAQWLTHDQNALTQRVIVNRVWQHLFGKGLVQSVDNFGVTGDTPSHPELLDHLAQQFVADGWSIRRLVRKLTLTRAYQLSSRATPAHLAQDPGNRLLWRHAPRRLTAEELRDATLAVAGKLDASPGNASTISKIAVTELLNNGPAARNIVDYGRKSTQRSIYLPLLRGLVPISLEVFDFAEQGYVTGKRDTTTVPQQALYQLNDPFVRKLALVLAEQTLNQKDLDDSGKVMHVYLASLGRKPTPEEVQRALGYIKDIEAVTASQFASQAAAAGSGTNSTPTDPEVAVKAAGNGQVPIIDPDQVDQSDAPVVDEVVEATSATSAAWASLCQAILGSAEFRYVK